MSAAAASVTPKLWVCSDPQCSAPHQWSSKLCWKCKTAPVVAASPSTSVSGRKHRADASAEAASHKVAKSAPDSTSRSAENKLNTSVDALGGSVGAWLQREKTREGVTMTPIGSMQHSDVTDSHVRQILLIEQPDASVLEGVKQFLKTHRTWHIANELHGDNANMDSRAPVAFTRISRVLHAEPAAAHMVPYNGCVRFWASPYQPADSQLLFFTIEPTCDTDDGRSAVDRYRTRHLTAMEGYVEQLGREVARLGGEFDKASFDINVARKALCSSATFRPDSSRYGHVSLSLSFEQTLCEYQRLMGGADKCAFLLLTTRQFKRELCTTILITSATQASTLKLPLYDPAQTTVNHPWRCRRNPDGSLLDHRWYLNNSSTNRPFLRIDVQGKRVTVKCVTANDAKEVYAGNEARASNCHAQWDKLELVFDMAAIPLTVRCTRVNAPYNENSKSTTKLCTVLFMDERDVVVAGVAHRPVDSRCYTHLCGRKDACDGEDTTAEQSLNRYKKLLEGKKAKRAAGAAVAAQPAAAAAAAGH